MAKRGVAFSCLIGMVLFHLPPAALGQTNSWTGSTSGNWEDSNWSLGVLPGTNQSIFITNSGTKVVTIGAGTAKNFSDSLSMDYLKISSPTNSANFLLVNDAGLDRPLTTKQLWVSTNSIVLLYASSLQVSDLAAIEGTFIQDGGSEVSNNYTPVVGTYNLNSGVFRGMALNLYGGGRFIQAGGTNVSSLEIDGTPEYDLEGGEFDGAITIEIDGIFHQSGGIANASAIYVDGGFVQSGGVFNGPTNSWVSIPSLLWETPTNTQVLQTGGTNREYELLLGVPTPAESDCTFGCGRPDLLATYTLSNGVLATFGTIVAADGNIQQSGGMHAISGDLSVGGSLYYVAGGGPAFTGPLGVDYRNFASYTESGGSLTANNIGLGVAGSFNQLGGTVLVASNLTLGGPGMAEAGRWYSGSYTFQDGTLAALAIRMGDGSQFHLSRGSVITSNLTIYAGTFEQDSGTNELHGGLSVQSFTVTNSYNAWSHDVTTYIGSYQLNGGMVTASNLAVLALGQFSQSGGQIVVSDIQLIHGAFFQTNGTIVQSGLLTLDGAAWQSGAGNQKLGQLQLDDAASVFFLPTNSCDLRFRDSSGLIWSTNAALTIQNWSGSLYGGGSQQLFFGNNSAGLTAQQLNAIHFQNPTGLPVGNYPARILATGEIVPDSGAPLPMKMFMASDATNGRMQLNLGGDIGRSYDIEVSTDLVNWTWWTNEFNSNGTICIFDSATNSLQKFYRAQVAP
jgi:hypothetical protein